jgi:DNA-binding MarR family transcriptional regulator
MKFERGKSAGYLTNWAARLFARAMDRRLKEIGMSSGQMPVLFALGDGGALTQKRLAELAALEQPTMAATLARMERDGLVERKPNPRDGRSALFSLTPAAMDKAKTVREAVVSINGQALSGLSEEEQAAFMDMMHRIVAALETE